MELRRKRNAHTIHLNEYLTQLKNGKKAAASVAATHNTVCIAAALRRSKLVVLFFAFVGVTRFGCVFTVDVAFFPLCFSSFTYITIIIRDNFDAFFAQNYQIIENGNNPCIQ